MSVSNVGYIPVSPMPVAESRGLKPEVKERPQAIQSTQAKAMDLERMGSALTRNCSMWLIIALMRSSSRS